MIYAGSKAQLRKLLTSALYGSEWSASRLGRFIPAGESPWYPLYRKLGGPQSQCGRRGKRKIPAPAGSQNPVIQPVTWSRYFLSYPGSTLTK